MKVASLYFLYLFLVPTGRAGQLVSHDWVYGQNEFYAGINGANIATSFLGSYRTTVEIIPNKDGSYSLNYSVTNTTGWVSGTRLRKDLDGNGQHDAIIPDKKRGEGIKLGGNLKENWKWSEKIVQQK